MTRHEPTRRAVLRSLLAVPAAALAGPLRARAITAPLTTSLAAGDSHPFAAYFRAGAQRIVDQIDARSLSRLELFLSQPHVTPIDGDGRDGR